VTQAAGSLHVEAGQVAMLVHAFGAHCVYGERELAPLIFTQAAAHEDPESPLRPRPDRPWKGSGATASGAEAEAGLPWLHAEQHFEYRRPIRVGEVLGWTRRDGRSWTKPGSSGVLHFAEEITEFRDANGELVVTSTIVRVQRGPRADESSHG
jgi:hypothetical protein